MLCKARQNVYLNFAFGNPACKMIICKGAKIGQK